MKLHIKVAVSLMSMTVQAFATDATRLVETSARKQGVPVELALQVAEKETGVQCGKVGSSGERGPLQILPSTARQLGYKNIRKASCSEQTDAGMKHLAKCYRGMGGNRWFTAACHNQGFSAISGRVKKQAKRYANSVMGI
jgi:soluble lytic murein transglycosylase-like protein